MCSSVLEPASSFPAKQAHEEGRVLPSSVDDLQYLCTSRVQTAAAEDVPTAPSRLETNSSNITPPSGTLGGVAAVGVTCGETRALNVIVGENQLDIMPSMPPMAESSRTSRTLPCDNTNTAIRDASPSRGSVSNADVATTMGSSRCFKQDVRLWCVRINGSFERVYMLATTTVGNFEDTLCITNARWKDSSATFRRFAPNLLFINIKHKLCGDGSEERPYEVHAWGKDPFGVTAAISRLFSGDHAQVVQADSDDDPCSVDTKKKR